MAVSFRYGQFTSRYGNVQFGAAIPVVTTVATKTGNVLMDFGAAPGTNTTEQYVDDQTLTDTPTRADAFMMFERTDDHTAEEHMMVPVILRCGNLIQSEGFTIYAESELRLTGTFRVHWIWG